MENLLEVGILKLISSEATHLRFFYLTVHAMRLVVAAALLPSHIFFNTEGKEGETGITA